MLGGRRSRVVVGQTNQQGGRERRVSSRAVSEFTVDALTTWHAAPRAKTPDGRRPSQQITSEGDGAGNRGPTVVHDSAVRPASRSSHEGFGHRPFTSCDTRRSVARPRLPSSSSSSHLGWKPPTSSQDRSVDRSGVSVAPSTAHRAFTGATERPVSEGTPTGRVEALQASGRAGSAAAPASEAFRLSKDARAGRITPAFDVDTAEGFSTPSAGKVNLRPATSGSRRDAATFRGAPDPAATALSNQHARDGDDVPSTPIKRPDRGSASGTVASASTSDSPSLSQANMNEGDVFRLSKRARQTFMLRKHRQKVDAAQKKFLDCVHIKFPSVAGFLKAYNHRSDGKFNLDEWQDIMKKAQREAYDPDDARILFHQVVPEGRDYVRHVDIQRLFYEVPFHRTRLPPEMAKEFPEECFARGGTGQLFRPNSNASHDEHEPHLTPEDLLLLKKDLVNRILQRKKQSTQNLMNNAALLETFRVMDVDGSGELSYPEMKTALGPDYLNLPWTDSQIRDFCMSLDGDRKGVVTYKDFMLNLAPLTSMCGPTGIDRAKQMEKRRLQKLVGVRPDELEAEHESVIFGPGGRRGARSDMLHTSKLTQFGEFLHMPSPMKRPPSGVRPGTSHSNHSHAQANPFADPPTAPPNFVPETMEQYRKYREADVLTLDGSEEGRSTRLSLPTSRPDTPGCLPGPPAPRQRQSRVSLPGRIPDAKGVSDVHEQALTRFRRWSHAPSRLSLGGGRTSGREPCKSRSGSDYRDGDDSAGYSLRGHKSTDRSRSTGHLSSSRNRRVSRYSNVGGPEHCEEKKDEDSSVYLGDMFNEVESQHIEPPTRFVGVPMDTKYRLGFRAVGAFKGETGKDAFVTTAKASFSGDPHAESDIDRLCRKKRLAREAKYKKKTQQEQRIRHSYMTEELMTRKREAMRIKTRAILNLGVINRLDAGRELDELLDDPSRVHGGRRQSAATESAPWFAHG